MDLAKRLKAGVHAPGTKEAVRLLCAGPWLNDESFIDICIVDIDDGLAVVDWLAIEEWATGRDDGDELRKVTALARQVRATATGWDGPQAGGLR